jgi:tRNA threonylcarbamoyladenosine biosynthesis protein TsaB
LAIDTSTERLCIALCSGAAQFVLEEAGGALASARLLPAVRQLMADAGVSISQLHAIAFGRGPGAFTGLRTACAVAQGLALGAGKPVLPLDSLCIVADDARASLGEAAHELWVAMDARMGEAYAAAYRWQNDGWHTLQAPGLWPADTLAAQWRNDPPACVAGSALDAFGERLPSRSARRVPQMSSRAEALLRVAQQAWRAGDAVDAALALPLYVRDRVALTTAERAERAAA